MAFGVLGFWVFGFLGVWVFGFLGFWVFGFLGFWVFGFLGFWCFGVEFTNFVFVFRAFYHTLFRSIPAVVRKSGEARGARLARLKPEQHLCSSDAESTQCSRKGPHSISLKHCTLFQGS
jgi:hypothetical protein